jgi:hypothetical protein
LLGLLDKMRKQHEDEERVRAVRAQERSQLRQVLDMEAVDEDDELDGGGGGGAGGAGGDEEEGLDPETLKQLAAMIDNTEESAREARRREKFFIQQMQEKESQELELLKSRFVNNDDEKDFYLNTLRRQQALALHNKYHEQLAVFDDDFEDPELQGLDKSDPRYQARREMLVIERRREFERLRALQEDGSDDDKPEDEERLKKKRKTVKMRAVLLRHESRLEASSESRECTRQGLSSVRRVAVNVAKHGFVQPAAAPLQRSASLPAGGNGAQQAPVLPPSRAASAPSAAAAPGIAPPSLTRAASGGALSFAAFNQAISKPGGALGAAPTMPLRTGSFLARATSPGAPTKVAAEHSNASNPAGGRHAVSRPFTFSRDFRAAPHGAGESSSSRSAPPAPPDGGASSDSSGPTNFAGFLPPPASSPSAAAAAAAPPPPPLQRLVSGASLAGGRTLSGILARRTAGVVPP